MRPPGWQTLALRDRVVNLDWMRRPVRALDRIAGPFPYYGASGIVDHVDEYLFDGLHLLVAEDGENLRTRKTPIAFLAAGRFWVNNHAHVMRGNDDNDTRFLSYVVEMLDISGYLTGSTQPKLTQHALGGISVEAPPLFEQRAVAATLGALDDKIESNRRTIDVCSGLLDATSSSLALEVDSVPLSVLAAPLRDAFAPSAVGVELIDHFSIPAFDAKGLPDRTSGTSVISAKLRVDQPSVLVSRLNPATNRTWFAVPEPGVTAGCSTEFLVLTPTAGVTLGSLWLAVRDEGFRSLLAQRATGTSGSHQRVKAQDALATEVPDVRQLSAAEAQAADELLWLMHRRRVESTRLAALRDALLPELLSGRLRVPAAVTT